MCRLIVLQVDSCQGLGFCDSVHHDSRDTGIADEHTANVQVHQCWSGLKKGSQSVDEQVRMFVITKDVLPEAKALEALLLLQFSADQGQVLGQHLAVDQLEVLKLSILIDKEDQIALRFLS